MTEISVCILVKNEAALLEQCLRRLHGADEIVVVDNGSTDATSAVASRYATKCLSLPGADFDEARNAYLEAASKRWILVLDADETVSTEALMRAKKEMACSSMSEVSALHLPIYQYLGYGKWTYFHVLRLIRNDPRIRYTTNGIHDTIGFSAMEVGSFKSDLYLPIHHFDLLHLGRQKAKRQRNITRLRNVLREGRFSHPQDAGRLRRFLGLEYMAIGRTSWAREQFEQAIAECPESESNSLVYLAHLYCLLGQYNRAASLVEDLPYAHFGPQVQVPVILAEIALQTGGFRRCLQICKDTLRLESASAHMHVNLAALLVDTAPDEALFHLDSAALLNPYLKLSRVYTDGDQPNQYAFQRSLISTVTNHRELTARAYQRLGKAPPGERDGELYPNTPSNAP